MLSQKPWKSEAILRLVLGLIVCQFLGALVLATMRAPYTVVQEKVGLFVALLASGAFFCGAALFVMRKPWNMDHLTRSFGTMLFCLYAGLTCSALADHLTGRSFPDNPIWRTVIGSVSLHGAAILIIAHFIREHATGWSDAFGFASRRMMALFAGVCFACAFLPLGWLMQEGGGWLIEHAPWPWLNKSGGVQPAVLALTNTGTWLDRLAIAVTTILLAPVAEELFFRGIVYPWVKRAGFPRAALWVTSAFFAAIHFNLPIFAPLLVLAIGLTLLYEHTGNLLAPIAAHSVFNALNFLKFYWGDDFARFMSRHP